MQFFTEYFDSYQNVDGSEAMPVWCEIYAAGKIFKYGFKIGFKRVDLYK